MPELILQRLDNHGGSARYPVYLNRVRVGNLAFGQSLKLELPEGRHQLHIGGWWAREESYWLEMGSRRKALVLHSEDLPWREWSRFKYYRLYWEERMPAHLPQPAELAEYHSVYRRRRFYAWAFAVLWWAFTLWLALLAGQRQDGFLAIIALLLGGAYFWIWSGMRKNRKHL